MMKKIIKFKRVSVQPSVVSDCDPMNRSTPGLPVHHQLSVVPFSSCPQSLPASGSFPMSQLLA